MSARSWMKFFPSDWRGDPKLRRCSLAARGLWIEMLGIMHEAEPRGHLTSNGDVLGLADLAALVGASEAEVQPLLADLEAKGVFSRRRNGVIYSRKMVAEMALSEKRAKAGRKGAEVANSRPRADHPERIGGDKSEITASYFGDKSDLAPPASNCYETEKEPLPRQPDRQNVVVPESRYQKDKNPPPLRRGGVVGPPDGGADPRPPTDLFGEGPVIDHEPSKPEPVPVQAAFDAYNRIAAEAGWVVAKVLTPARQKHLRLRVVEAGGLSGWENLLRRGQNSGFLSGRNDRGWRADLDWWCQPGVRAKVIEGKYDDGQRNSQGTARANQRFGAFASGFHGTLAGRGPASAVPGAGAYLAAPDDE